MLDAQYQFWNQWSTAYQGFSETIEPYRSAQRSLAQAAIAALINLDKPNLSILDVGGGAGNLIRPLLEALIKRRGNLKGVSYTLTDGVENMIGLARERVLGLQKSFPDVKFNILHLDTLTDDFNDSLKREQADLVVNSWNIEYYPHERRREMVRRLAQLTHPQGVVAFSCSVKLPGQLGIRDVLMPLGQAQVLQALLTGGPAQMKKVITSLKQIAEFGTAVSDQQFPEKPYLSAIKELAEQAGLHSVSVAYHLFGASVMVVAYKDGSNPPALPKTPISQPLFGQEGYEEYPEKVSFWSYFTFLLRNRTGLQ